MTTSVVFIDASLPDYQTLVNAVAKDTEIVLVQVGESGLAALAAWAETHSGYDSIAIVGHGSDGVQQLGTDRLDTAALSDSSKLALLQKVGSSLTADGDLLLYGCDVAKGETGLKFVQELAQVTGADVAASSNLTGAASFGGDWVLETQTGNINSTSLSAEGYAGILAPYTIKFTSGSAVAMRAYDGYFGSTNIPGINIAFDVSNGSYYGNYVSDSGDPAVGYILMGTGGSTNQFLGNFFRIETGSDAQDFSITSLVVRNMTAGDVVIHVKSYATGSIDATTGLPTAGGSHVNSIDTTITQGTNTTLPLGFTGISSLVIDYADGIKLGFGDFVFSDVVVNTAPALGGTFTTAGVVNDNATTTPFSGVTYTDADGTGYTVGITYTAANGTLASGSGGLTGSAGNYTLTGSSAADVQSKLQALVFTPTANQVAVGSTVQTTFTLTPNDGVASGSADATSQVTVTSMNNAPTDMALSNASVTVYDAANAQVGALSTTDADPSDTFTYSLVSGTGDTDNTSFNISGNSLRASNPSGLAAGTYSVRVRTTDAQAGFTEKTFNITVTDVLTVTTNADEVNGGAGYAAELADGAGLSLREALAIGGTGKTISFGAGLSGQTLTMTSNFTVPTGTLLDADAAGTLTINYSSTASPTLANITFNNGTGDVLTFGPFNGVSGAGTWTKTGAGTLQLGAGSFAGYSGSMVVSAGTVKLGSTNQLSSGLGLTIGAGATFDLNDLNQTVTSLSGTGTLTSSSNAGWPTLTLNLASGQTNTFSGPISGSHLSLNKISGTGTLQLDGATAVNIGGDLTVSAGVLELNKTGGSRINTNTGRIQLGDSGAADGDIIRWLGDDQLATTSTITAYIYNSGLADLNGHNQTLTNSYFRFQGGGEIRTGSGILNLNNSYVMQQSSSAVDINGNLQVTGNNTTFTTGTGLIDVTAAISGSGKLSVDGTGTLKLGGVATYSGQTAVATGATLSISGDSNIGSGALSLGGGTLLVTDTSGTIDNPVVLTNTSTVNSAYDLIFSGVISSTGHLVKAGASTLTLAGNNTYSGSTTVNAGTLKIAADGNLGGGQVNLAAGTTLQVTGVTTIDNAIVMTGNAAVQTDAAVAVSSVVSGAYDLAKTGMGALTLSGTNTYSGATTVSGGKLVVNGSLATSAITVASGATLAGSGTIFSSSSSNSVTVGSGATLAPGNSPGRLTINGNLAAGSGTLALELTGTTAGTQYDQLDVYGSVDLTNATLNLLLGSYAPSVGSVFTIVLNDLVDAVTGTFATVQVDGVTVTVVGNRFTAGGVTFDIAYNGGTGNDVTLTVSDITPPTPSVTVATVNDFGHAVVQSNETGTAYLVNNTITVSNLASITGSPDTDWNQVTISAINTNTNLAATGLNEGVYSVYAVDASGNLSSASTNAVTIDNTPPATATGALAVAENAANSAGAGVIASTGAVAFSLTDTAGGRFAINGTTGAVTVADATLLNFEANTSHSITVRSADAAGNTTDTVLSVSVADVNEVPVNTKPAGQTFTEDGVLTFSVANGNALSVADVDAGTTLTTVLSVASGTGTLLVTAGGGGVITGDGTNSVQIVGTVAQVQNALSSVGFTPTANGYGASYATLTLSSTDNGTLNDTDTVAINITGVADTPSVTNAYTTPATQTSSGLVLSRNAADGAEVGYFKITGIANGSLFKADGTTGIANGTFITYAEGDAGLRFTPTGSADGGFSVQASTSNADADLGGSVVTAVIAVGAAVQSPTVNEDIDSGAIAITLGGSETHYKITSISGGTLYSDSAYTNAIANGSFIAQGGGGGNAGTTNVYFRPASNANSTTGGNGSFVVQASSSGVDAGLIGVQLTSTVTLTPVADTPSVTDASAQTGHLNWSGLVLSRNLVDGAETTHFKISGITNGSLFKNDGTTAITNGTFIAYAEGHAGLKFSPSGAGDGSFSVEASTDGTTVAGSAVVANIVLDNTAPVANASHGTPADDAAGASVAADIVFPFAEPLDSSSDLSKVYLKDVATDTLVPCTVTINGSGQLLIHPTSPLAYSMAYYVTWDANALKDAAGNAATAVTDETTFNFTTESAPADDVGTNVQTSITKPDGTVINVTQSSSGGVEVVSPASGSLVTASGTGDAVVTHPGATLILNNTGSGVIRTSGLDKDTVIKAIGNGSVHVDMSGLQPGNVLVIDNTGRGTVDLSNLPDGVMVKLLGTGPVSLNDTDGATSGSESKAPSLGNSAVGDGNGDGIPDALQSNVASVSFLESSKINANPDIITSVFLSLVADAKDGKVDSTNNLTASLSNVRQLDVPDALPAEVTMPLGLISFDSQISVVGAAETLSLYVDASVPVNGYWQQDAAGVWCNLASAAYGGQMVAEGGKTRLDFTVTDGSAFDSGHEANGLIEVVGFAGSLPLSLIGCISAIPVTGYAI